MFPSSISLERNALPPQAARVVRFCSKFLVLVNFTSSLMEHGVTRTCARLRRCSQQSAQPGPSACCASCTHVHAHLPSLLLPLSPTAHPARAMAPSPSLATTPRTRNIPAHAAVRLFSALYGAQPVPLFSALSPSGKAIDRVESRRTPLISAVLSLYATSEKYLFEFEFEPPLLALIVFEK